LHDSSAKPSEAPLDPAECRSTRERPSNSMASDMTVARHECSTVFAYYLGIVEPQFDIAQLNI
jgi:hypothetical protein